MTSLTDLKKSLFGPNSDSVKRVKSNRNHQNRRNFAPDFALTTRNGIPLETSDGIAEISRVERGEVEIAEFRLDRKFVLDKILPNLSKLNDDGLRKRKRKRFSVVSAGKSPADEMHEKRIENAAQILTALTCEIEPDSTGEKTGEEIQVVKVAKVKGHIDLAELKARKAEIAEQRRNLPDEMAAKNAEYLAEAELKFALLSGSRLDEVKSISGGNFRQSDFVLYNYARIVHILSEFEAGYPPQGEPEPGFGLHLTRDEEWNILLDFILVYPDVQREVLRSARIDLLFKLLIDFSNLFSVYYRSCRILLEPLPHLWPQIYARIEFLKVIKCTLDDIFLVIGINPVRNM